MQSPLKWVKVILILLMLSVFCLACQPATGPRPTVDYLRLTPIPSQATATLRPTYTPTPHPLGSFENPIVMAFITNETVPGQDNAIFNLTGQLSQVLGVQIKGKVFNNYIEFEKSMKENEVHAAWLGPVEYILAARSGNFQVSLVTNHLGITSYGVQFFAHKDSLFKSYFDISKDISTASAGTALAQFSGTRPCLVDNSSLTGYWVPLGFLAESNIPTLEPALTSSTTASLRALYIKGVCDFTATYAHSGDPRTANAITTDLPDIMQQIIVIWRSNPIIPNLNLSFSDDLGLPLQSQIQQAVIAISRSEAGLQLLTDANDYSIAALASIEDKDYDALRTLLDALDVNLKNLINK